MFITLHREIIIENFLYKRIVLTSYDGPPLIRNTYQSIKTAYIPNGKGMWDMNMHTRDGKALIIRQMYRTWSVWEMSRRVGHGKGCGKKKEKTGM